VTRHSLTEARKRNLRVLLADDNRVNRMVGLRLLEKMGIATDAVSDGKEVLEALAHTRYDLILMDVQMPDMDGLQTTSEIRRRRWERSEVPIVALTAHAMKGDRERCIAAGMDDYLSKPIRPEELVEVVTRWTQEGASHGNGNGVDGKSSALITL
jgi:CheY-like chemotaxis protein